MCVCEWVKVRVRRQEFPLAIRAVRFWTTGIPLFRSTQRSLLSELWIAWGGFWYGLLKSRIELEPAKCTEWKEEIVKVSILPSLFGDSSSHSFPLLNFSFQIEMKSDILSSYATDRRWINQRRENRYGWWSVRKHQEGRRRESEDSKDLSSFSSFQQNLSVQVLTSLAEGNMCCKTDRDRNRFNFEKNRLTREEMEQQ